ncbi:glycosyltransferase [Aduncisulcus paluster]|uniref:Glycosyltransferase n=1 Tax=Aduncisulcus paluster TaxID=2918883 RepID=A0ABQ5K593_9EUKA|nr:glycosyltransferase [Aduncisulcus paluster]
MKPVLILHGYLLEGSGSNLWTRSVAKAFLRSGRDVHLFCQEPEPEKYKFINEAYKYTTDIKNQFNLSGFILGAATGVAECFTPNHHKSGYPLFSKIPDLLKFKDHSSLVSQSEILTSEPFHWSHFTPTSEKIYTRATPAYPSVPKCIIHKPNLLSDTLPVFVTDKYKEYIAVPIPSCLPPVLGKYIAINAACLLKVVEEVQPSIIVANHTVLMPTVAQLVIHHLKSKKSASIPRLIIVPHGSALEYVVRRDERAFVLAYLSLLSSSTICYIADEIKLRLESYFTELCCSSHYHTHLNTSNPSSIPRPVTWLDEKLLKLPLGVDTTLFTSGYTDIEKRSALTNLIKLVSQPEIGIATGREDEEEGIALDHCSKSRALQRCNVILQKYLDCQTKKSEVNPVSSSLYTHYSYTEQSKGGDDEVLDAEKTDLLASLQEQINLIATRSGTHHDMDFAKKMDFLSKEKIGKTQHLPRIIAFVGRLIAGKGLQNLLLAMPLLLECHHDICLVVVGSGPLRPLLELFWYSLCEGAKDRLLLLCSLVEFLSDPASIKLKSSIGDSKLHKISSFHKNDMFERSRLFIESAPETYWKSIKEIGFSAYPRVIFAGYLLHHQLAPLLTASSCLCCPSVVKEAGPLVYLEGLASCCICVGTDMGGVRSMKAFILNEAREIMEKQMEVDVKDEEERNRIITKECHLLGQCMSFEPSCNAEFIHRLTYCLLRGLELDKKHLSLIEEIVREEFDWEKIVSKL